MNAGIEHHTIYQIPLNHRYGHPRDQFTIWFSTNMTLLTVVTGALGPTEGHLSFPLSVIALLLGSIVGGLFMALHAAQGPALGVPQMIQSRGQFGVWGAVPVIAMVIIMYIGFVASNCVVGGDALQYSLPQLTHTQATLCMALLSFLPCIFGYKIILKCSKPITFITTIAVVLCFALGLYHGGISVLTDFHGGPVGFAQTFSIAVLWQISYAPYVSDSSRYLPAHPKTYRATFWACYTGTICGSVIAMSLGAFLAAQLPDTTVIHAIHHIMGLWSLMAISILGLSIALANAMDLYCSTLSTITLFHTFRPSWKPRAKTRIIISCITIILAAGSALLMSQSFNASYTALLDLLMAIMIPWTAINLVDFYIIQHGHYHIESFFCQNGGSYGYINIYAIISYFIGIITEIPFINLPFYKGIFLIYFHNIDISWVLSLCSSALSYFLLRKSLKKSSQP